MSLTRVLAFVAVALPAVPAAASTVTFTGDNGQGLSASATFSSLVAAAGGGYTLSMVLANTGDPAALNGGNTLLTGLFFDVSGGLLDKSGATAVASALAAISASGVTVTENRNVAGEWAFKNSAGGFAVLNGSAAQPHVGLSAAGLGDFGPGDRLSTASGLNLTGPASVGGADLAIVPGGDLSSLNKGMSGLSPFIQNSLAITLHSNTYFTLDGIGNVFFQYGTNYSEGGLLGTRAPLVSVPLTGGRVTPLPAAAWGGAVLLAGLGVGLRRRNRRPVG
jgi:hypothetical protein